MYDGVDTVVLYEELAFQDVLPVLWRPPRARLDRETAASFAERNMRVLQAWDAMEEHGTDREDRREHAPTPPTSCAWS